jgi:Flp pilus assembly protein TadB
MDKWDSRKYRSAWGLTWLVTALLVVPWLVNAIFAMTLTALISANVWSMVVMAVWGTYFAANVAEKHSAFVPDDKLYDTGSDENG